VSDRAIFMDEGKIVEQGPPKDVFKKPSHERTRTFLRKILERTE
jgi:ABC-type polar amino acid transport system ATPase subunit